MLITINYIKDFDVFNDVIEIAYTEELRHHHALDDAKANRLGWLASEGRI